MMGFFFSLSVEKTGKGSSVDFLVAMNRPLAKRFPVCLHVFAGEKNMGLCTRFSFCYRRKKRSFFTKIEEANQE
jgi:hypothetical protein